MSMRRKKKKKQREEVTKGGGGGASFLSQRGKRKGGNWPPRNFEPEKENRGGAEAVCAAPGQKGKSGGLAFVPGSPVQQKKKKKQKKKQRDLSRRCQKEKKSAKKRGRGEKKTRSRLGKGRKGREVTPLPPERKKKGDFPSEKGEKGEGGFTHFPHHVHSAGGWEKRGEKEKGFFLIDGFWGEKIVSNFLRGRVSISAPEGGEKGTGGGKGLVDTVPRCPQKGEKKAAAPL